MVLNYFNFAGHSLHQDLKYWVKLPCEFSIYDSLHIWWTLSLVKIVKYSKFPRRPYEFVLDKSPVEIVNPLYATHGCILTLRLRIYLL